MRAARRQAAPKNGDVETKLEQERKQSMSKLRMTRRLVAVLGVASLFTAYAATAQQVQELPKGSNTYPVHFATGSSQLDGADQDTIRGVAAAMRRTPTLTATIIGKTDAVGSADFNHHLSEQRARAVFEALVYTNKAPEDRVELRWTGENVPFVSTADEQAESLNRVVAIILQ
jgi:outer membrane protein OmpA-like peptidoglycan-associated protein